MYYLLTLHPFVLEFSSEKQEMNSMKVKTFNLLLATALPSNSLHLLPLISSATLSPHIVLAVWLSATLSRFRRLLKFHLIAPNFFIIF